MPMFVLCVKNKNCDNDYLIEYWKKLGTENIVTPEVNQVRNDANLNKLNQKKSKYKMEGGSNVPQFLVEVGLAKQAEQNAIKSKKNI